MTLVCCGVRTAKRAESLGLRAERYTLGKKGKSGAPIRGKRERVTARMRRSKGLGGRTMRKSGRRSG